MTNQTALTTDYVVDVRAALNGTQEWTVLPLFVLAVAGITGNTLVCVAIR